MTSFKAIIVVLSVINYCFNGAFGDVVSKPKKYEQTWESLDTRPVPKWYDEAKVGIFIHWGVYAVPSFGSEWFWNSWKLNKTEYRQFMAKNYRPGFTYQEFAKDFTAEFFNAGQWADLFKKSGAKYVVLTSKHHEGYTLWPSKHAFSWNAEEVGPHRDLVGELARAIRSKTDLVFGLYHSLYEWYNPLYLEDKANHFQTNNYIQKKMYPELMDIVETYKPEIVWSDGDWEAKDVYWKSKEFLAYLYNDSPVKDTVVVNDRWGIGIMCKHAGVRTCSDRFNPGVVQKDKWENAMTIDRHSWGFRRNAKIDDYLSTYELVKTLAETVSCGGNLLMNVGPTSDGIIAPIFQERLLDIGKWLAVNGDAIYSSKPWTHQNDTVSLAWYTAKENTVYAISLSWPEDNTLKLGLAKELFKSESTVATLLGNEQDKLKWTVADSSVDIKLPKKATVKSNWAWVIKITNA